MVESATEFDLLDEPTFEVEDEGGRQEKVTLPGALARLGAKRQTEFCGLQPHQYQAWYCFLVQLAAIAVARTGEQGLEADEAVWKRRLLALTEGKHEPWCLVVADLSRPAFMQPPVPEGTLAEFSSRGTTPDRLDMLVTSKGHDVKRARVRTPRAEHWAYALVNTQTMDGFAGRDNYGIVRMKGSWGNRPFVGTAPGPAMYERFVRDVAVWLERRDAMLEAHGYAQDGAALLWLLPWQGDEPVAFSRLDPFFIEVCRRFRIARTGEQLEGWFRPTKSKRLLDVQPIGSTGDAWTPVDESNAALCVGPTGLDYKRTQDLLLGGEFRPAPAQRLGADDGAAPVFIARALVRGGGETQGLHERIVPIPPARRGWISDANLREQLAQLAQRRVTQAADVKLKALRPALSALLESGESRRRRSDDRPNRWSDAYEAAVDRVFFDHLFRDADLNDDDADRVWLRELVALARDALAAAIAAAPYPAARRYKAIAAAEGLFEGSARKNFALAFAQPAAPEVTA